MIKVSVIIPIYNVEKYLSRLFVSLKRQKLSEVEYILVDDGSTDDSLRLCYEFKNEMNNVKVIHQKNMGVGPTRNVGLKNATGKYVYFCDPDDTIEDNLLSDNYYLAEKYKADLIIFGFDVQNITKEIIKKVKLDFQFCSNKIDFIKVFPTLCHDLLINYLWNKFYRREIIQNLSFEDVRTGEDIRFNMLVYNLISRVLINDKVYYHYLQGRPNSSQILNSIDDISLYLQEDKIVENLFFNIWNKKNNSQFIKIVEEMYQNTGKELLSRVEARHLNYIERNKLLNKFASFQMKKYFNFKINKGLKYNYEILIFKLRYFPLILPMDNILRNQK